MQRPRTTSQLLLLLITAHALAIALACGGPNVSGRDDSDPFNNFFDSSDPLNDLFGSPKVDGRPREEVQADKPAEVRTAAPMAVVQDKPPQRASFFDIPAGWQVERHSPEAQMYKLIHPDLPRASLVLSTQAIEGEGDLQEQLRSLHNNLVGKLPSSFKRVELREWIDNDDAHILTRMKGERSDDKSEVQVIGHSLARARRAYLILGASAPEHRAAIEQAVDKILPTIHSPAERPTASKL
jgi:hypothetical protein